MYVTRDCSLFVATNHSFTGSARASAGRRFKSDTTLRIRICPSWSTTTTRGLGEKSQHKIRNDWRAHRRSIFRTRFNDITAVGGFGALHAPAVALGMFKGALHLFAQHLSEDRSAYRACT